MDSCCDKKQGELEKFVPQQKNILLIVFLINLFMFFVEFISGYIAYSNALLGDSLDMLGDAIVYGLSFYVVTKGLKAKTKVAFAKGIFMSLMALGILIDAYLNFSQGNSNVGCH